jgi:hypothetical protein
VCGSGQTYEPQTFYDYSFMATAFDNEESMTHEEILLRFKKVMGRDMTHEEKHKFFLPEPPEVVAERINPRQNRPVKSSK